MAEDALDSGTALQTLKRMVKMNGDPESWGGFFDQDQGLWNNERIGALTGLSMPVQMRWDLWWRSMIPGTASRQMRRRI